MARPSVYTAESADKIISLLTEGQTLREICRNDEELPAESTVRLWVADDREGFAPRYTRAREVGYMVWFDEIIEIADDGSNDWMVRNKGEGESETVVDHEHISRSRERINTRKWALSKALPKLFGDRLDLNAKHDVSDQLADLMRAVDGRTKGLPGKREETK